MRPSLALTLVFSAACAAQGAQAPARPAQIVKEADLPPKEREALAAWRRGGETWEAERAKVLADAELSRFLVDNLIVEMVRSFDRSAIGTAVRPNAPFDRAQAELVVLSSRSTPVLAELLAVKDGVVSFLAADTLKRIGREAVEPATAKLDAAEPEVRRRAAELLGELPAGGPAEPAVLEKLGNRLETDPAWIVRAQAARSLGSRAARQDDSGFAAGRGFAAESLSRALSDGDPEVAKTAMDALSKLGEASAVPALIRRLERAAREGDLPGLKAAQVALRRLTGVERDLEPEEWWAGWERRSAPPAHKPR